MITMAPLTAPELASWAQAHYLVRRGALDADALATLTASVEELVAWPETPGAWMRWYETSATTDERILCRVENFVPFHAGLRDFVTGDATLALLGALMGEPACLYKDKINLKLPGGAGFGAHQDAPAFGTFGHRYHITMMVALDDMRPANGCLELSDPVEVYETLAQSPGGTLDPDLEARLEWRPLEVDAGDVVFFDSYLPHRSLANTSNRPRRALYLTYNRQREGDRHTDYFAHKRATFPPECERVPGVDYSAAAAVYNLGNPIR